MTLGSRFSFSIELSPAVEHLHAQFKKAGYELYLVGGAVRDCLMGRRGSDMDFATNATPDEMQALFSKIIPTGLEHGTLTILIDGEAFEVTTYRQDGVYLDGRKPDKVFFSKTLSEDLKRRDFTINAFAYDLERQEIIDLYSGREDLKRKCIRTIGQARERFQEDALRMMRACRFVAELDFTYDRECFLGIQEAATNIKLVSPERIRDELTKLLLGPVADRGIEAMRETGLLKYLLPKVFQMVGVKQNLFHAYDVYEHTLAVLRELARIRETLKPGDPLKKDVTVPLAGLLHDIAKPETRKVIPGKEDYASFFQHEVLGALQSQEILKQLRFSKRQIQITTLLVREHMLHSTQNWGDGAIRKWLGRVEEANVSRLLTLVDADRVGRGVTPWSETHNIRNSEQEELKTFQDRLAAIMASEAALKISDLKIGGDDLMKTFQLKPSPVIGKILKHLLEKVLEDPSLNTRTLLLAEAKMFLHTHANNSTVSPSLR